MLIRVGLDEAGYGPLLGPLVIASASVVDSEPGHPGSLWDRLSPTLVRARGAPAAALIADDSKVVMARRRGVERLEASVLATLTAGGSRPLDVASLLDALGVDRDALAALPFYAPLLAKKLPVWGWRNELDRQARRLEAALEEAGLSAPRLESRVLDARRFNLGIRRLDNKADLHFETLGGLLVSAAKRPPHGAPVDMVCDKLGGRDRYGRRLATLFAEGAVRVLEEGRVQSRYQTRASGREVTLCFRQKADANSLLAALASMLCKYLRELCMDSINSYFEQRIPGLTPTRGYTVDGRRFMAELDAGDRDLGCARDWLVRER